MELITAPLLGKDFVQSSQNCYTCVRGFFTLNSELRLPDVACPTDWWEHGLNIFADMAHDEGFRLFDGPPREMRVGDIPLMALGGTKVGNHIGVIMPANKMIHHMMGQRSSITQYGGLFRNNTVAVYRHPDVSLDPAITTMTLQEVLPPNAKRRLENYLSRSGSQITPWQS